MVNLTSPKKKYISLVFLYILLQHTTCNNNNNVMKRRKKISKKNCGGTHPNLIDDVLNPTPGARLNPLDLTTNIMSCGMYLSYYVCHTLGCILYIL